MGCFEFTGLVWNTSTYFNAKKKKLYYFVYGIVFLYLDI